VDCIWWHLTRGLDCGALPGKGAQVAIATVISPFEQVTDGRERIARQSYGEHENLTKSRTGSRVIAAIGKASPHMRLLLCYSWLSSDPDWPDGTELLLTSSGHLRNCFVFRAVALFKVGECTGTD
jgi:hypothetical protein